MTKQEMKARALVASRTTKELVEQFELTETINDPHISIVRGWLMDELAKRNYDAYDAWLDSLDESPRKYFLA